jgi:hypothetical protein
MPVALPDTCSGSRFGFHPPNFSQSYLSRMDDALSEVDRRLHAKDAGPAVYVTQQELKRAFPPN